MKRFSINSLDFEKVNFSSWRPWDERNDDKWRKFPGVYLIAISGKKLKGKNPSLGEIVYVGTSFRRGGLSARWRQLNRSINGGKGHWAGHDYKKRLILDVLAGDIYDAVTKKNVKS